jgi:phage-related protein
MANEIIVGGVAVSVTPDLRGFNDTMRRELVPPANRVGQEIGREITRGIIDNLNIGRAVEDATTKDRTRILAAAFDAGRRYGTEFRRGIESALRGIAVTVNVSADTTRARAEIARLGGVVTERVRTIGGGTGGTNNRGSSGGGGGLGITAGEAIGFGSLALIASGGLGIIPALVAAAAGVASFGAVAFPTLKGISTAMTQVTTDTNTYNRATTAAGRNTALAHIKQDLAALSPGQRTAVLGIQSLQKNFDGLAKTFAPLTLTVLNDGLKLASQLMPIIMKFALPAGLAIDKLLQSALKFSQSQGFRDFVNRLALMSGPAIIAIGDAIGHLAIAIGKLLTSLISPGSMSVFTGVVDALAWAITGLGNAYAWLTSHVNPGILHDVGVAIVAIYVGVKLWAIAQAALDIALNANPIGLIILGLAALTFAIIEIVRHWTGFSKAVSHAWDIIYRDTIGAVIKIVRSVNVYGLRVRQVWISQLDAARHEAAHIWDIIYNNTIGAVIRIHHSVLNWQNRMYHDVAHVYDLMRHDIAAIWDATWKNTVGRAISGAQSLMRVFGGLKNSIIGVFRDAGSWLYGAGKAVIQGLWNGMLYIWNKVTGWIGGLANWIKAHKGPLSTDLQLLQPAGRAIMSGLRIALLGGFVDIKNLITGAAGNIQNWLTSVVGKDTFGRIVKQGLIDVSKLPHALLGVLSKIGGFASSIWNKIFGGGGGVAQWAGTVAQALAMLGLPLSLGSQVLYQMQTESGGNPKAINLTDINAQMGDPSRGLMQVIGSTFAAYHVPGTSNDIYDPLANIAAALNYAAHGRGFGSGAGQLGSGHGYDDGGWVPPGASWFWNGTGENELAIPMAVLREHGAAQANALAALAEMGGPEYHAHFDGLTRDAIESHVRTAFVAMNLQAGALGRQGRRQ